MDALDVRIKQAREAAQACLDHWPEQSDALVSGVMLGFSLDARGLDDVWIEDTSEVPSGPLQCIANAVYPIDWTGVSQEPLTVTLRIRYDSHDSGA